MSFTFYHTPFDGISPNITPIYNGLPYSLLTVSQWYERPGFKYVADIYVDGGTDRVARLKHDADKDTNVGVFDFGRIIENWVYNEAPVNNSTLQSFSPFNDKEKSVIPFEIKWGMEMDRYDIIINWLPSLGNARLVADSGNHNLRTGDYVVIRGCGEDSYNGAHRVIGTTTSTARIETPYVSNPTEKGEFIEAEGFVDNNYWYDYDQQRGMIGWIIPTFRPTEIEVGDTVTIVQDPGATNPGYDGEWLVVGIDTTVVGGTTYQRIKTNCPWLGNTPLNGGAIYPTNRKRINENLDTSGGYVFNGVLQYDEYLDWDPSEYQLGFTSGKFLTNLPQLNMIKGLHSNTDNTRMLKCSRDEYLTLSFLYGDLKDE